MWGSVRSVSTPLRTSRGVPNKVTDGGAETGASRKKRSIEGEQAFLLSSQGTSSDKRGYVSVSWNKQIWAGHGVSLG